MARSLKRHLNKFGAYTAKLRLRCDMSFLFGMLCGVLVTALVVKILQQQYDGTTFQAVLNLNLTNEFFGTKGFF